MDYHINDKVLIKHKGKWHKGRIWDIYEWCYIVLLDTYMIGTSNIIRIDNPEDIKLQ